MNKTSVRKLAREATIFALLGLLIACMSLMFLLIRDSGRRAKAYAQIVVHGVDVPIPAETVDVPLSDGTILHVLQCDWFAQNAPKPPQGSAPDCRDFSDKYGAIVAKLGGHLVAVPLGDENQIAIEKDYWNVYRQAKRRFIFEDPPTFLLAGLLGFPSGLGIWILYRLIRFAIKG